MRESAVILSVRRKRARQRGLLPLGLMFDLAAMAVAASAASWATYELTSAHYEKRLVQQAQAAQEQADTQSETFALRARAYEAWRARQQPKTVTIIKEIDRALQNHRGWADGVLPDSVRQSLERAATESGAASQPDGIVPAVPSTTAGAEQRPGPSLR